MISREDYHEYHESEFELAMGELTEADRPTEQCAICENTYNLSNLHEFENDEFVCENCIEDRGHFVCHGCKSIFVDCFDNKLRGYYYCPKCFLKRATIWKKVKNYISKLMGVK